MASLPGLSARMEGVRTVGLAMAFKMQPHLVCSVSNCVLYVGVHIRTP